jgi:PAS domain S-box-containing protein
MAEGVSEQRRSWLDWAAGLDTSQSGRLRFVQRCMVYAFPWRYPVMFTLVVAATIFRIAITPFVSGVQFSSDFLAVVISTLAGGLPVGLASVAFSALSAWFFILPPTHSLNEANLSDIISLSIFVLVGSVVAAIVSLAKMAIVAFEESRRREAVLETRMRDAEELRRWKDVFENVTFGISIIDPESNTISCANRAFGDLVGMPLDSLKGASLFDMYPPAERERVATLCDTSDRVGHVDYDADRCRNDGSMFPSRVHVTSVREANGAIPYRIVTTFDISAQRRLEAEVHQAQKLEAIGQLTAGIAHDFNNLLQGLIANLELLDDEIQARPQARQFLAAAIRIAEQGGELTRYLLSFARQQVLRPGALDLAAFLGEFCRSLARTLDPRIRVEMTMEPGLPPVWTDPAHLHTALLNLAINSRDAMRSGGRLLIEASSGGIAGVDAARGAGMNRMVTIRVSDTGTGMASEALAKACEPFFTTKGLRGTGLGLSMVYGFAKQSGGDLRITSELGKGTCVQLCLPLAA